MQKKIIAKIGSMLLLAAILVACLLSGCNSAHGGIDQTILTQEQREAISTAYMECKIGAEKLYWFQTDGLGAYYLGEIEGYIIFYNLRTWNPSTNEYLEYGDITDLYRPDQIRPLNFTVGEVTFSPGFQNQMCVYKDGEVLLLSRAYFKGWISKEGVAQVKNAYDSFVQHLAEMGESEYLKNEKKFRTLMHNLSGEPMDDFVYQNFMNLKESREYQLFMNALKEQGG